MRNARHWWSMVSLVAVVSATPILPAVAADLEQLVFVANRDSNDLVVIDSTTDRIVGRMPVGARPHMSLVTAGGKVYTTSTNTNEVTVVDARTLAVEGRIAVNAKGPEHATFAPDGKTLWVANVEGNAVSVLDLASGRTVRVLRGLSQPHNIIFTTEGKSYVTQVGSYRLAVYAPDGRLLTRIPAGHAVRLAALKPEEVKGVNNAALIKGYLFATNQDAGEVAVIDTRQDRVVSLIKVGREPWEPYETPDHTKVLVPNLGDETVSVIDVKSRAVLATLPGGKDMTGINPTADSKKAYVIRRGDDKVSIIDLVRLRVVGEIAVGKTPEVATRTAGGKLYVANSGSGDITVIDTASDRVVTTITGVGQGPWAVAAFNGYNYCH